MDTTQKNKISLILPTYHPDRLKRANALYDMLKTESGVEVEVIVACDNPDIYDKLKYDVLVKIPKRVGFTRAVNIAEKFATNELIWWIDDYVIPQAGWGLKAVSAFYERFPDGMGIMDISQMITDCAKSLSTRRFMYKLNGGNFLWPEYIHCGDTESWVKATALNAFYTYPEMLWQRDKIYDACKTNTDAVREFDVMIMHLRESTNFENKHLEDYEGLLFEWGKTNPKIEELYKNIYNINE